MDAPSITLTTTDGWEVLISPEDAWALTHRWSTFLTKQGNRYVKRCAKVDGKWTSVLLHRDITKAPKGCVVDHLHSTLDNRRGSLLVCTQRRNLLRAWPAGECGVYPSGRKWKVHLSGHYRGTFDTHAEAVAARIVWHEEALNVR